MRKLFLLVAFAFIGTIVSAQEVNWNWGVKARVNFNSFGGNELWKEYGNKTGFNVGAFAEIELKKSIFLESGLYLSTKGTKLKEEGIEDKFNLMYLQLPVLGVYKYELKNDFKLFGKFGPYFGLGLSAKNKGGMDWGWDDEDDYSLLSDDDDYDSDDETIKGFGEDKTGLKRGDFGLLLGIGVQKGKYSLGLNYELGLLNISSFKEAKTKNRTFSISIGYTFK
jgi:hypothetical protein